jgi:vancomycin resistance protein YoaR
MKKIYNLIFGIFIFLTPVCTFAYPNTLTFQYDYLNFDIDVQKSWIDYEDIYTFDGSEVILLTEEIPKGVKLEQRISWDKEEIKKNLDMVIGTKINRESGKVTISKSDSGNIEFDGVGLTGRKLDSELAAEMTIEALENNVSLIQLPVEETNPRVAVRGLGLRKSGIRGLIAIGESDYSRSPANRRHNIRKGLEKFNGHIIKKDEEFSFNKILGPVNDRTGFLKELTILGARTLPAFGGGLCQVSTTSFRGAWIAGFPISSRRNHSYAVRYYFPIGTDATIFPPWTDLKFINDTSGSVLIQTYYEDSKAYFIYYGSKPKNKQVELIGPFVWDRKAPPPPKTNMTTEIPPGDTRIVSNLVPGMKSIWYRYIENSNDETLKEEFYSDYEPRGKIEEIGIDPYLVD